MKPKFYEWLRQQPKEFVNDVNNNEMLGNGAFQIDDLIELDRIYNPEGEDNDRSNSSS